MKRKKKRKVVFLLIASAAAFLTLKMFIPDLFLGGCGRVVEEAAQTTDSTAPTIESTSPASGATGVSTTAAISVIFSETMDAGSISTETYTFFSVINQAAAAHTVTVTFYSLTNTATAAPTTPLSYNTTYEARLSTGIKDSAGNALASQYTWRFTTTTEPAAPTYSIAGKVNFATTSDGIRGGAAITAASSSTTATATADSSTGTYEVRNLPPGTYTLSTAKTGWTIGNITATIAASSLIGKNFTADPTSWEVLNVGGIAAGAMLESITSTEVIVPGTIVAVGKTSSNAPIAIKAAPPYSSWSEISLTHSNEGFVAVVEETPTSIDIIDRQFNRFESTGNFAFSFGGKDLATTEAIADYSTLPFSDANTYEVVTESGRILRTTDSGASRINITPSSGSLAGIFVKAGVGVTVNMISIAGNGGKIGYSTNGGTTWNDISSSQFTENLIAVCGVLGGSVVGSVNGTIAMRDASTLTIDLEGVPYPITGLYNRGNMSPFSGTLACGGNGLIMRRR